MMSDATRAKRVLVKAEKLLRTKGWCQGVARDQKGRFCSIGAINEGTENDYKAITPVMNARVYVEKVIQQSRFRNQHIIAWNDTRGRTKQQVLKVFRAAIKLAEKDARA
jgi:hypothetical protein